VAGPMRAEDICDLRFVPASGVAAAA
jgi:hypothetical protein